MKARPVLYTLGMISAALLLSACQKDKSAEVSGTDLYRGEGTRGTTTASYREGTPGGTISNTYTMTARVDSVDPVTRKIVLSEPNGKKSTIKAGSSVQNFDQIKAGDQVKAKVDTEVDISVRPGGGPTATSQSTSISTADKGEKPGFNITDQDEITGTVTAVDTDARRATIRFPDGQIVNVKARPDVDLTKVKAGDEVFIRTTQAVDVSVESPRQ